MDLSLMDALCCPFCHGSLSVADGKSRTAISEGVLGCSGCGPSFEVIDGIPVLGDREHMAKVGDSWREGVLTQERYKLNTRNSQQQYQHVEAFRDFIDAAASAEGLIVDVATGPGGSFMGALVPRLGERSHFLASDVAVDMLRGLRAAWEDEPRAAKLDFAAFDGHRMALRDASVDAFTAQLGFQCCQDDPTQGRSPRSGGAYREAYRALRPGGAIHGICRVYDADSKTAPYLQSLGSEDASWENLEQLWASIGFEVTSVAEVHRSKGKSDPCDGLPIDDADEWSHVAYVLRKQ
jgi:uncharacterized protein YbaR (Trm112 family)/ubiquinone/menaquinone biosynthesis C-methylase UbiE